MSAGVAVWAGRPHSCDRIAICVARVLVHTVVRGLAKGLRLRLGPCQWTQAKACPCAAPLPCVQRCRKYYYDNNKVIDVSHVEDSEVVL